MSVPHYEPQRVFKTLSKPLLRQFFEEMSAKHGVALKLDWTTVSPRKVQTLAEAFEALPMDIRASFNAVLYFVNLIGAKKPNATAIHSALIAEGVKPPDDFHTWCVHDMALWAFLHGSERTWKDISTFAQIAQYSQRAWVTMKLDVLADAVLNTDDATLATLKKAVCDFVFKREMRGDHGFCNHYTRRDTRQDYFVIFMNDHVLNKTKWRGEDRFEPGLSNDAFEIDFIYDRKRKEIHVRAEGDPKKGQELCRIWAKVMLGAVELKKRSRDTYHIQTLKDAACATFKIDPKGKVQSAEVIALHTFIYGDMKRRRSYEEPNRLYDTVQNELKAGVLTLDDMTVLKVRLRVNYVDAHGVVQTSVFNISRNSSNYLSLPEEAQAVLREFMMYQGILDAA